MTDLPLTSDDRRYLERAAALGRRGWGGVHPNPLVGCVLVKDGEVVAEGWHEEFGGPHAEIRALERAGPRAAGATAYVSLEPCRHEGKTPACTLALLRSGVSRVVFGASDPGAESGGGATELAAGGAEVVGPVFDDQRAWSENPAFHHWHRHGTPHVAVKLALSLDGAVAARPGERTRLTGPEAQQEVHRLRAGFDAVLVGSNTARVDDPLLTVRDVPLRRPAPIRIVLDSGATLPSGAALLRDAADVPVWVFCREDADEVEMERLESAGARVHPVPAARAGPGVSLEAVLERCGATGVRSILCEGGGVVASRLLAREMARRLYLLVAPTVLGVGAVPAFPGVPAGTRWHLASDPVRCGDDILLTLDRRG
ncbi:MAG TPA: bifunctional diaminohydroxyphosphoribosylaminopyrimidine deaminase/5-amino-6-(5-phosphoribosylamino)uracil reductase RibD [Longimicrobiales bacterium]|nr:bifunctional diaminohydroxyphosphoribosylaminopyrimidine deaminase/5-amino-6-(5-phosphoribosylamino)uracil reductase RibD [Longimicrobiales bacterium]